MICTFLFYHFEIDFLSISSLVRFTNI